MTKRTITQEEFDKLLIVNGVKICPSHTDYTQIKNFGEGCHFGEGCYFGMCCHFGEGCHFGAFCHFGMCCLFGVDCHFGVGCHFGENCTFGMCCHFGENCTFGMCCRFGVDCTFEMCCHFGEGCYLSVGCRMVNHTITHRHIISLSGLGEYERTLYVWITESGVYCQAGCFFGSESDFRTAVKEKYGESAAYLKALDVLKNINEVK